MARWVLAPRGASHCCGPPCTPCARVVQSCCCLCAHFPPPGPWYCTLAVSQNSSCCRRGHCGCRAALPLCAAAQRGRQEGGSGRGQRWAWLMFAGAATEPVGGAYSGVTTLLLHRGAPPASQMHTALPCHLQACSRVPGVLPRDHAPCRASFTSCSRCLRVGGKIVILLPHHTGTLAEGSLCDASSPPSPIIPCAAHRGAAAHSSAAGAAGCACGCAGGWPLAPGRCPLTGCLSR